MLRAFILLASLAITIAGCNKSDDLPANETLTGTWKYSQRYYSPGSGIDYESTEALNQSLTFGTDGSFSASVTKYNAWNHFEQLDSIRLRFTGPSQVPEKFFFRIDTLKHKLTLSSADHICIEGCGDIFRR